MGFSNEANTWVVAQLQGDGVPQAVLATNLRTVNVTTLDVSDPAKLRILQKELQDEHGLGGHILIVGPQDLERLGLSGAILTDGSIKANTAINIWRDHYNVPAVNVVGGPVATYG